jgi:ABC-type nitrate/sulfonate/bicarbonate transport system permease component
MKIAALLAKIGPPLIMVLAMLAFWETGVAVSGIEPWRLPAPSAIAGELAASFPRVWMHTSATLKVAVMGLLCGAAAGLALAVAMHFLFPWVRSMLYPLIILTQNIPIIAIAPLFIVWFGFQSILPKLIIIMLVCFFPVLIAALQGFSYTDRNMVNYMRMIGASRGQLFRKLEFPHALPHLFSGLKVAGTYSMMGGVISEWLGSEHGLGVYMRLAQSSFRTDRLFVAITMIVAASLVFFALIAALERMFVRGSRRKE